MFFPCYQGHRLCLHLAEVLEDEIGIVSPPAARIHPSRKLNNRPQSIRRQMLPLCQQAADLREKINITLLS